MFRHSDLVPQPFIHRRIVAMEAFFDESGKFHSGPIVALCGVVGNYADLEKFNQAFDKLINALKEKSHRPVKQTQM